MGTSSIFNGPIKPLIPSDYDDFNDIYPSEETEPDEYTDKDSPEISVYRWKDAKDSMTRYVKGSSTNRGKVLSRYVGASGGSRQFSRTSISGKSAAINLGRIIQGFRENGVKNTLQSLQIDYVGKSAKEVLSELVNIISGKADTKEDIAARGASGEAISELYNIILENNDDIEALRNIDEGTFSKVIEVFMSEYIFRRVMNDLQSRFEKYESNPKEAVKKEQELKNYIKAKVELKMRGMKPESKDYRSNSISKEMSTLFQTCFKAFVDYV